MKRFRRRRPIPTAAYRAEGRVALAGWIRGHRAERFFAVYSTMFPHHPYYCPNDGDRVFPPDTQVGRYRNALHYADRNVGNLLDVLGAENLIDDTIVVVVADHGETVSTWPCGHGMNFSMEELHVPLILSNPGLFPPASHAPLYTQHPDVAPTLLGLLGLAAPPGDWLGRDLTAARVPVRAFPVKIEQAHFSGIIDNGLVYELDEKSSRGSPHLSPVPLGAPGEIVFSGVCVGRGYINDPERTKEAFLPDPHRPGQRIYRSGDHGRWLPDGKLEFLGRKDTQVKISGFRIEIGEIEDRLLRLPGVREGAVVTSRRADGSEQLVAFYSGDPLDPAVIRERLGNSLPKYMVPSAFHRRQTLPLTGNGKIDRKALKALAGARDAVEQKHEGPNTETERRLAAAWSQVLGVPRDHIGRRDHFFDLGGTSLSALRLAIVLDRMVSLKDLAAHPVLADQAELIARLDSKHPPAPAPAACVGSTRVSDQSVERSVKG